MIFNILPTKDTTIYSENPHMNTGLDEILELRKSYIDSENESYYSRILIYFNNPLINSSPTSSNYELKLFETENKSIPLEYTIYCHPISGSWQMGTGKEGYIPEVKNGANWKYRDGSTLKTKWSNISGSEEGGSWYTSSISSQSFEAFTNDINIDVTNIVNDWKNNTIPNNGFILKRSDSIERNNENMGELKFFSSNTNTIFKPRLAIKWDDSVYTPNTGSQHQILPSTSSILFYPTNLSYKYNYNSKARINMYVRSQFPNKTYFRSYTDNTNYYVSQSYYSVIDDVSNEIIIPFDDNYTKLSVDSNGNYFMLWMDQFELERNYRLRFKVLGSNNTEYYYDNGKFLFKVVKIG